jgi:hypothetical protein
VTLRKLIIFGVKNRKVKFESFQTCDFKNRVTGLNRVLIYSGSDNRVFNLFRVRIKQVSMYICFKISRESLKSNCKTKF